MKTGPILFLALRNILGRPRDNRDLARRTLRGAVLSVAVSMVPLVVTLVVADGMIQGITARYIELSSYHIQCVPYRGQGEAGIREALASLGGAAGVRGAWAESQAVGVAFARGKRGGALVRAVDPGFLEDPGTRSYLNVLSGEASFAGPNDVLLGSELARNLGAEPGSTVNLISLRNLRGDTLVPRVSVFRVRGIVSSGYRDLDSRWFLVPQETSGRYLTSETSRRILGVKVDDPFKPLDGTLESIRALLPEGWGVVPWPETERNLYESFRTTRYLLLLIMGLTVAVAAANISSALITLVTERSQEIAILKGLGATPADIGTVFVAGGMILGFAGSVLGTALGILAAVHINELIAGLERVLGAGAELLRLLAGPFLDEAARTAALPAIRILNPDYYLENIPVILDYRALGGILAAALFLSYLASLLPARKAASLSPLEIIRRR